MQDETQGIAAAKPPIECGPEEWPPLDDAEREAFEGLKAAMALDRVGLMRVNDGGVARAVLAVLVPGEETMATYPVAVLLDSALFAGMQPPGNPERLYGWSPFEDES